MNEHQSSKSERIWNAVWVLLLATTLVAGVFVYMRIRQVRLAEAQEQAEERAAVERLAELEAKAQEQQQQLEQLEIRKEALLKQAAHLGRNLGKPANDPPPHHR